MVKKVIRLYQIFQFQLFKKNQADGQGELESEEDDPERDPHSSGPGLHEFMFGEPLDPFAIFGMSRKKWWDGENVCLDRKVIKEDEEGSTDETVGKGRGARGFDMSFTTCRDEVVVTFHFAKEKKK